MKIFVDNIKISDSKTFVGIMLAGDLDQIYFTGWNLLNLSQTEASLMAIRRAFAFKKNMKPLFCNEPAEVFNNFVNKDMLINDEFCSQFKVKEVTTFENVTNETDLRLISEVKSLTQVDYKQYYLMDIINNNKNCKIK